MEDIQVVEHDGVYSCDIDISKDEWLVLLQDKELKTGTIETLLRFYYMPEHRGSCAAVSKKMGGNAYALNLYISKFGQFVKKRLNRFEVYGTDGKTTRWIIPMCKGRNLSKGEEGAFEWELRPELVEAIREYLYWYLLQQYKKLRNDMPIRDKSLKWDELYKWELITSCEGKSPIDIITTHLANSNKAKLGGFSNLIDAVHDNKALKYAVEHKYEKFSNVLDSLADESLPLIIRLANFKQSMTSLLSEAGLNSKANDERTAATILTCLYPHKYTFYKHDELYDRFCKYLGENTKKAGECYAHYLSLLAPLAKLVAIDDELQEIVTPMLEGQMHSDLLLAQDVLWMLLKSLPKRLGFIYNLLFTQNNMENNANIRFIELLENNYNLILTGAPGTGKTYLAKQIAAELLQLSDVEDLKDDKHFGFVQFHPSYDYTDFIEGLRPINQEERGNIGFERKDGIFKEFCKRAALDIEEEATKSSDSIQKPYIFVIDEINRGELSKIFGELFFSIDPGYRGVKGIVNTQYQNLIGEGDIFKKGFYIPENVYIIGTMNDIDRSVESMDFAMRRRFAWQEVTAEESYANMIENEAEFAGIKDEIKARMFNLNNTIANTEGLNEAYQIGAAYFRKYLDYQDKEKPFECLWNNHLKGLLFEYLRGNRKAKELLEKLHKAYNKTSIDEQPAHTNEGQL